MTQDNSRLNDQNIKDLVCELFCGTGLKEMGVVYHLKRAGQFIFFMVHSCCYSHSQNEQNNDLIISILIKMHTQANEL